MKKEKKSFILFCVTSYTAKEKKRKKSPGGEQFVK